MNGCPFRGEGLLTDAGLSPSEVVFSFSVPGLASTSEGELAFDHST